MSMTQFPVVKDGHEQVDTLAIKEEKKKELFTSVAVILDFHSIYFSSQFFYPFLERGGVGLPGAHEWPIEVTPFQLLW